jgi:hypothetical protein
MRITTTETRISKVVLVLCACLGVTLAGCAGESPKEEEQQQAPTAAVSPLISTNAMMVGLVDDASHEIWDAVVEGKKPKTDEDWYHIQHHATKIALSGTLITIPGTGKADAGWVTKPEWIKFATELRDGGMAALEAARKKDIEALSRAGDQLVTTCEGCHKVFKGDLPSEGIIHQREVH